MKMLKKGLILSLTGVFALTLASCSDKEKRNQTVPYGSISDTVVASAGDINLTQKELYNRLKYSYGSTVFTNKLNRVIYAEEYKNFSYSGDDKITIDEAVASAIYGSSSVDTLKTLTTKEKETSIAKYIDTMTNQGFILNADELVFDEITSSTKHVSFSKLSQALIENYAVDLIKEDANIAYLQTIADSEYLPDEDNPDSEEENDYYIDEDALESEYNSNSKEYYSAHGIVLRFNSLSEANRMMTLAGFSEADLRSSYVKLYNAYYSYKTELTANNIKTTKDTTFVYDEENNDLTNNFSSSVSTFFKDNLNNADGLTKPRNIDGSYYLIYREDLIYTTTNTAEVVEYADLNTLGTDLVTKIKADLRQNILENNASSVSSKVFTDRMLDANLKIYDPYLENSFANSYTDYEYVTTVDNNLIFSSSLGDYSVNDFYKDLTCYNINETLITLLVNKFLYQNEYSYLDDDAETDYRKTLKDNIKDFNDGKANLSQAYGEANYLFYTYGYYTVDEVVLNNMASQIQIAYLADYIYDSWASKPELNDTNSEYYNNGEYYQINYDKLNILHNILNKALELYGDKEYLDLNVDHILISVDNNGDGDPDDMDDFLSSLSTEEKNEFQTALNDLAKAILAEAEAISFHTNMDKLNYIVTAFNRNLPLHDGSTWDEYKTYNFILTAESLGDVTTSSVTNYVEPFQDYLKAIYAKAIENELEIPEDDKNGIFYSANGALTSTDFKGINFDSEETSDLCQTNYGFHMLSLNSYDEESTNTLNFEFLASSDSAKDYYEIVVEIDEDAEIEIKTDTYSTTKDEPSDNQLLVYYVQYTEGDVNGFRTSIENDLSDLLDDTIAKFQTNNFQTYLLIQRIGTITTAKELVGNFNYEFYMDYLVNQMEEYEVNDDYANWYDGSLNWSRY